MSGADLPPYEGRIRRLEHDAPGGMPLSVTLDDLDAQHERGWVDYHPEDFCHRCGNRNVTWATDGDTWNTVMRDGGRAEFGPWHEIICIPCFTELADLRAGRGCSWRIWMDASGCWRLARRGRSRHADGLMTRPRLDGVPNTPGTPRRTIRIADELWLPASELAAQRGESVSDVVRRALEAYVDRPELALRKGGDNG